MKRFLFSLMFASMLFGVSAKTYCADIGVKTQIASVDFSPDVSVLPAVMTYVVTEVQNYNLLPAVVAVLPEISYDFRCAVPAKTLYYSIKTSGKSKGYSDINYNQRYSYQKQFL
jgi:hypothetical protein